MKKKVESVEMDCPTMVL